MITADVPRHKVLAFGVCLSGCAVCGVRREYELKAFLCVTLTFVAYPVLQTWVQVGTSDVDNSSCFVIAFLPLAAVEAPSGRPANEDVKRCLTQGAPGASAGGGSPCQTDPVS